MKFSKGKGLLAILAMVVALTPVVGKIQVSASDTDGLSGIAKVLADATPNNNSNKTISGVRSSVGVADVVTNENEPQLKSVRLASFILREPKVDIDELIESARLKAWESKAIVTVDENEFVYMRSEPNTDGSVLGIMPHGAAGTVIEEHGEWSYVNSGQIDGYVCNDYLAFGEEALEIAEDICGYVAYVETFEANVRSGPSLKEEVITTVPEGMYFEVMEQDNGWVKIRYTKDQEAYMSEEVVDVFLATGVAVHLEEEEEEVVEEEASEPESNEDEDVSEDYTYETSDDDYDYDESSESETYTDSSYSEESDSTDYVVEETPTEAPVVETVTSAESVFKITAYCPCSTCCGAYSNGMTASGTSCTPGRTIAVDPSIIPIGTTVYIDGVPYVAEDTGVSGYQIDIYMPSHVEALNWGVRYCTVTW